MTRSDVGFLLVAMLVSSACRTDGMTQERYAEAEAATPTPAAIATPAKETPPVGRPQEGKNAGGATNCASPARVTLVDLLADAASYLGKCVQVRALYYQERLWRSMDQFTVTGVSELPTDVRKKLMQRGQTTVTVIGVIEEGMGYHLHAQEIRL